jgi:hypothetical protein
MFEPLVAAIEQDLADLRERGRMTAAEALSRQVGRHFNAATMPLYFTGDLAALVVLVHLNPKQADAPDGRWHGPVPSVEKYLDDHRHFGRHAYGAESRRTHRSPFDHKQIRFLRPFGVINFVPDDCPGARYVNLERIIDDKAQLEVVPYGSDTFKLDGSAVEALEPHFRRLLDVICAVERRYVLFCGTVFDTLLAPHIVRRHQFRLTKNDGTISASRYRFANVELPYQGRTLRAGLASSFAIQGIPMAAYGAECAARY